MSTANKFEHARFYDAALDNWVRITPAEFDPDIHDGRIVCSTADCHAALSFVSAHGANAGNIDRNQHFRTNPYGENHIAHCPLNPDPMIQASLNMQAAIDKGMHILLNINFSCSPIRERGRLHQATARQQMAVLNGEYRKDWLKRNKGGYAPFSGHSAERLKELAAAYKKAFGEAVDPSNASLVVSYLHGAFPWDHFYGRNHPANDIAPKPAFTPQDIFNNLFGQMRTKSSVRNFWAPAPALRMNVRLLNRMKNSTWDQLYTNFREHSGIQEEAISNTTTVDGQQYVLQDVIDIRGDKSTKDTIRRTIQDRDVKTFSLVATPYIRRANVKRALNKENPLHIYWPIASTSQLIL